MSAAQHIVDPRSGVAATGLLSMTVVGPSLTFADAYSTAAFVMGERGASWVAGIDGYEALAITTRASHRVDAWSGGVCWYGAKRRRSERQPASVTLV